MSIYATLWSSKIQNPALPSTMPRWVKVTAKPSRPTSAAQALGAVNEDGDPYRDFLPPPVKTNEFGEAEYDRAIVFVTDNTRKGTARNGQEYIDPLLVLTGEEYAKISFQDLLQKLAEAVCSGPRVVLEYFDGKGETHIFRDDQGP